MCMQSVCLDMDNYQGDLTDILRASGGAAPVASSDCDHWQFPSSDPMNIIQEPSDNFGDPFSNMQDPLLNELDMATSSFFNTSNSEQMIPDTVDFGGSMVAGQRVLEQDDMNSSGSCNSNSSSMFSRMMISPNPTLPLPSVPPCDSPAVMAAAASPRSIKSPVIVASDMINANSSKGNCLVDSTGLQISSPRNPGIKRRKSQAKKVVCIPAPAAANGRPGGEVVPSDLWAWRKYGQKPIKGSPYPRGYYRCSSSKGCSARKQVERSRTDPNMLVITYTSEHNHPWPTQRNALAGSTRSQASKANATSKGSPSSHAAQKTTAMKEEQNDTSVSTNFAATSLTGGSVKEETTEDIEKQLDIDDADFVEEFCQGYIPTLPDSNQSEDLFAEIRELEADPLNLIFSQALTGNEHKEGSHKPVDPFSLFDWPEGKYNSNNNSPFGDKQ